jgi:tetratricopeptide (TPR) repeat protein
MALAQLLSETGQWTEAADQARMAKQLLPQSVGADLLDARTRLQLLAASRIDKNSSQYRDMEAALDNLEKVTPDALEVKLLKFRFDLLRGDFPGAESIIAGLKKTDPTDMRIVLAEADLLVAQKKTDEAIARLREIIAASPQPAPALKYLVSLLAAKEDYQQCETLIKNALASAGQPAEKRDMTLLLADVYSRSNEDGKRYSLLNTLAEQLQDDIPVQRELLTCGEVLKDSSRAQQVVDKIKSVEGDDGWQWRYEQARIWFAQEDFKSRYPKIVSLLQENLLANPDDQASRMLLAAAYEKGEDHRLAVSTYIEALNRSPKDVRIIVPAVTAFYRAGEYDRAEEILKRAADEGIYHPELERLEAQGSLRRGDFASANDVLEKMYARDTNNYSAGLSLSLLKIRQNKLTEAQELLEKLKALEPNSLPIAAAQVELDIRRGKSDDALKVCDEMVNKLGTVSAFLFRARTYAVLGRSDKAKDDFGRAVKMEPNNADAWIAKSVFHHSIGESNEAVADIRHALSVLPDNLQIRKTAISLYLVSSDSNLHQQGEALLEKTLESNPEDVDLLLQKVKILLAKNTAPDIEQAAGILQSITEKQPEVGNAWALLAQISLQEGKPAKAIDSCLRGLVHRPNDKTLLLLKARGEAARSPGLALPTLRALWELDPNDTETTVSLAEGYVAAGQYADAVNLLQKQAALSRVETPASRDDLQQRRIMLALAMALYKNGSKTESEEMLRGLYESDPNDPRALLAQIQLMRDDKLWDKLRQKVTAWCDEHSSQTSTAIYIVDELARVNNSESTQIAEELLRCVLKREADSPVIMFRLGILLQSSGRPAEAAAVYQRVLELQPDNLIAINNLAWILCEEQKRPQEAVELAQRGLTKAPDYYRLGQLDKAVQDFKRCIRLYPGNTQGIVASYFHLGRCLAGLGEKMEAIGQLNKALELEKELGGLDGPDLAEARKLLTQLTGGGN